MLWLVQCYPFCGLPAVCWPVGIGAKELVVSVFETEQLVKLLLISSTLPPQCELPFKKLKVSTNLILVYFNNLNWFSDANG